MSAIVASMAPHLRVAFWHDWRAWTRTPLKRWVLVDDLPIGGYESPLQASATPWAPHRQQGCAAEDDLDEYQMAAEQP
eukprot:9953583-Heterocapsa_arctica.AAC.1